MGKAKTKKYATKNLVYTMTTCAMFAGLMCILGPRSIPIGAIPISLTNLVIYLAVYLLGGTGSTISYLIYLLLGLVGLPVFSNFSGGPAKLLGPTGGYLIGFIFMALISGLGLEVKNTKLKIVFTILGMIVGTIVAYAFGTAWYVYEAKTTWAGALTVCVFPFIPFDLAKIAAASIIGIPTRYGLIKAGLLPKMAL